MQLPLFIPENNWVPPEILPDFRGCDAIAMDNETKDPNLKERGSGWARKDGNVIGFSIGLVRGSSIDTYYLPIAHEQGSNLDKDLVLEYMSDLCGSNIPKIFFNSMYDIGWNRAEGIETKGEINDAMFAAALIDENRTSYSLDNISKDWIGTSKDERLLEEAAVVFGIPRKNIKANLYRLPPELVGPYAEQDVKVTYDLWKYEQKLLERDGLEELFRLEIDLVPMFIKMRERGIRVDVNKAEQLVPKLKSQIQKLHKKIRDAYEVTIAVWENESLARAFDKLGLSYTYTPTGLPSFTKEFLAAHDHPITSIILRIRQTEKTINTFLEGTILSHSVNGRIHTELHPLKSEQGGTVTGRLSSSNPNLQQTTARDAEFAPMIRGLFLPEKDTVWGAFDYSSQEPRLTVHYAYLTKQNGAEEAVRKYNEDPNTDYHGMVAELANIPRKDAKTINLGITYGMGGVKLCHDLGLPTERKTNKRTGNDYEVPGAEGKEILNSYHESVPFVKGLINTCSNLAQERGWIRTIEGRLCHFDTWELIKGPSVAISGRDKALKKYGPGIKRAFTYKALNRLIQGSAADMTKKAMRAIYQEGQLPMLQMHDELDMSISNEKEYKICEQCMVEAVNLSVPIVVDCEFGQTWGSANQLWKQVSKIN
jgi:DNA polymerase I-like protein with 3'-5' exonuclease and polymerase domains